jgi:hypothetical protein
MKISRLEYAVGVDRKIRMKIYEILAKGPSMGPACSDLLLNSTIKMLAIVEYETKQSPDIVRLPTTSSTNPSMLWIRGFSKVLADT